MSKIHKQRSFSYAYPKADVTVDCVLFGFSEQALRVVLIRRAEPPYQDAWALPGGFIELEAGETALEAAYRELEEETGVQVRYLEQLQTFDAPDRDPRGRTLSIAHFGLVQAQSHSTKHGSDASAASWVPVEEALAETLAFDHGHILRVALERLRAKVRYAPIGFSLLPGKFTLAQLQRLYEVVLGRTIDKRNFRRRVLAQGLLVESGLKSTTGRPARLYRFDKRTYDRAVRDGFTFAL